MRLWLSLTLLAFRLRESLSSLASANVGGRLLLSPKANGAASYVRKAGEAFLITCRFEAYTDDRLRSLEWLGPSGDRITADAGASVRVQSFGSRKELSLLFKGVAESEEGEFRCVADVANSQILQRANVRVIHAAEWLDSAPAVGGMRGERLFVDCRAQGEPSPVVSVTNGYNQAFRDPRFSVADSRLTIDPLQEADEGQSVICTAAQAFAEEGITNVQSKAVRINVWLQPQMSRKKLDFYAIPGRNASIACTAERSNPPVKDWTFFKGTEILEPDGRKYSLHHNGTTARLDIAASEEHDLGDYKCIANNGQSSGEQYVTLRKALAPGPVEVALERAEPGAIHWKVVEAGAPGELPVTQICIRRLSQAALDRAKGHAETAELWLTSAKKLLLTKGNRKTIYSVSGLRPSTAYVFRFSAVNEAGWGDFFQLAARTAPLKASAAPSLLPSLLSLGLALLVRPLRLL